MSKFLGYAAAGAYIASVVVANSLSTHYGFVSVGFGLMASAGTYAAGAALGLRDAVQEGLGKRAVFGVIALAGVLSYFIASPAIATASAAAFTIAELCDLVVYTPMRKRGWVKAVIASNIVGGLVDTVVFLHIAGFPTSLKAVEGQMVGKILWATLIPVTLILAVRQARKSSWATS